MIKPKDMSSIKERALPKKKKKKLFRISTSMDLRIESEYSKLGLTDNQEKSDL